MKQTASIFVELIGAVLVSLIVGRSAHASTSTFTFNRDSLNVDRDSRVITYAGCDTMTIGHGIQF